MNNLKAYFVWDANIRWFHWINLLCTWVDCRGRGYTQRKGARRGD